MTTQKKYIWNITPVLIAFTIVAPAILVLQTSSLASGWTLFSDVSQKTTGNAIGIDTWASACLGVIATSQDFKGSNTAMDTGGSLGQGSFNDLGGVGAYGAEGYFSFLDSMGHPTTPTSGWTSTEFNISLSGYVLADTGVPGPFGGQVVVAGTDSNDVPTAATNGNTLVSPMQGNQPSDSTGPPSTSGPTASGMAPDYSYSTSTGHIPGGPPGTIVLENGKSKLRVRLVGSGTGNWWEEDNYAIAVVSTVSEDAAYAAYNNPTGGGAVFGVGYIDTSMSGIHNAGSWYAVGGAAAGEATWSSP